MPSVPAAKKCSITPLITSTKHAQSSKITGAGAIADVADTLYKVAAQFSVDSDGTNIV